MTTWTRTGRRSYEDELAHQRYLDEQREKDMLRRAGVTLTVFYARCPVHGERVARNLGLQLVGKCSACAGEAADGIVWLRRNRYRAAV